MVTPIYSGVKGKVVNKNSNGSILLLVIKVSTSSMLSLIISIVVTWIGIVEILIGRGTNSKHVPSLSGLFGFVKSTSCSLCLEIKMWEIAPMVLVPILISTETKSSGTYLNSRKAMW